MDNFNNETQETMNVVEPMQNFSQEANPFTQASQDAQHMMQNPFSQVTLTETGFTNTTGEVECVMSIKDFLILTLLMLIPFYNIYLLVMICLGKSKRANKTITNYYRFILIVWVVMFLLGFFAGIVFSVPSHMLIANIFG